MGEGAGGIGVFVLKAIEDLSNAAGRGREGRAIREACNALKVEAKKEGRSPRSTPGVFQGVPLDVLLKPINLACGAKNPLLQETALGCLHKIIAYGHLKDHKLLKEIVTMAGNCAESENPKVQLGVLRALLTILTIVDDPIHGEPVIVGVRVCYNLAIGASEPANRATARSALVQIMGSLARRATENVKQMANATPAEENPAVEAETGPETAVGPDGVDPDPVKDIVRGAIENVINKAIKEVEGGISVNGNGDKTPVEVPTSEVEGEMSEQQRSISVGAAELASLADKADVSAIEKALDADAHLDAKEGATKQENVKNDEISDDLRDLMTVTKAMCKLAARPVNETGTEASYINRGKALAIHLIVSILDGLSLEVARVPAMRKLFRSHICVVILRNALSSVPALLENISSLLSIMTRKFRSLLKIEMGALLPLVFIRPLESNVASSAQVMSTLQHLRKLLGDPFVVVDLFVNYDCDLNGSNLFERLLLALAMIVQGQGLRAAVVSGKDEPTQGVVAAKALHCLIAVVNSMYAWATEKAPSGRLTRRCPQEESNVDGQESLDTQTEMELLEQQKATKTTLEIGVAAFNKKPAKGLRLMSAAGIVDDSPRSIAKFLLETPGLNKSIIGDYLGDHKPEHLAVLQEYANLLNFSGMDIDEALRLFVSGFRLPGEAQKIDRIVERFSERYCVNNPDVFKNPDAAYVLSFAVVMLNTDAHNPQVVDKMSKESFRNLAQGTEADTVPPEMLEGIYDRIVGKEIKLKDEESSLPIAQNGPNDAKRSSFVSGIFGRGELEPVPSAMHGISALQNARDIMSADRMEGDADYQKVTEGHIVKPMMEVIGGLLLNALISAIENIVNLENIVNTLDGLHNVVRLATLIDSDGPRELALETILKTGRADTIFQLELGIPKEEAIAKVAARATPKQCLAVKHLLEIASNEFYLIGSANWTGIARVLSSMTLLVKYLDEVNSATDAQDIAADKDDAKGAIQTYGQASLFKHLQQDGSKIIQKIYESSCDVDNENIVAFVSALVACSRQELSNSIDYPVTLSRVIEVAEMNEFRLRSVWNRIWQTVSEHLVDIVGKYGALSTLAVDTLTKLMRDVLHRDKDFSHAYFQAECAKPLVPAMRNISDPTLSRRFVEQIGKMAEEESALFFSGWKFVFASLAIAAQNPDEKTCSLALAIASKSCRGLFSDVPAECFPDVVNCLSSFANQSVVPEVHLEAIAALKLCGDTMGRQTSSKPTSEEDLGEYGVYWITLFAISSELALDQREDVRTTALDIMLDLIGSYSETFSAALWKAVFSSAFLPLFDPARSTAEEDEEGEWLEEACKARLPFLCALLTKLYPKSSALLSPLIDMILQTASRSQRPRVPLLAVRALTEVINNIIVKLRDDEKDVVLGALRTASLSTFPVTLIGNLSPSGEEGGGDNDGFAIVEDTVKYGCQAYEALQTSMGDFMGKLLKMERDGLAWEIFDMIQENVSRCAKFNSLKRELRVELLRVGKDEQLENRLMSSFMTLEVEGWQSCIRHISNARMSRSSTEICDEKHIALVENILSGEHSVGNVTDDDVKRTELAKSTIASLVKMEPKMFKQAMQTFFLRIASLATCDNPSIREVCHLVLKDAVYPIYIKSNPTKENGH